MVNFIIRRFIKDYDNTRDANVRESYGKLGSIVGILSNAFLSLIKIIIGLLFNSISITADGANNLSDTSSSIITFIGFKIGGKPADKEHPFGHARLEYIAGLVIGFAILLVGVELIKSSYNKIVNPEPFEFSFLMIVVLLLSIAVKFWQWGFYVKLAMRISSSTLKATAMDSRNDVITTFVILVSIIISKITGYQIDGYMGLVVALFIIYSGINIVKDIMNPILGELPSPEFVNSIERKILNYEGIINIHDLVVHNYGPSKYFATVHAEIDARENILKSHDLIDNIERDFANDLDINLVIHLDPVLTDDKETNSLKEMTEKIVNKIDNNLSIHDFRIVKGNTHTNLIFDVAVPYSYKLHNDEIVKKIKSAISKESKIYFVVITIDKNYVSTHINKPLIV